MAGAIVHCKTFIPEKRSGAAAFRQRTPDLYRQQTTTPRSGKQPYWQGRTKGNNLLYYNRIPSKVRLEARQGLIEGQVRLTWNATKHLLLSQPYLSDYKRIAFTYLWHPERPADTGTVVIGLLDCIHKPCEIKCRQWCRQIRDDGSTCKWKWIFHFSAILNFAIVLNPTKRDASLLKNEMCNFNISFYFN